MIESSARDVWKEIERHLRPFVARRLSDPNDVGDVLHDIYLRIQKGVAGLRETDRFGPWVYQVARHAVIDHGRARARHPRPDEGAPADTAALPAVPWNDEDGSAERDLAQHMAVFVAALPSPYREAVTLTELQGMTQKEAAEMLGISLSGMKSRVQRGRRQLQDLLQACCEIALDPRGRVMSFEKRADGTIPRDCCAETIRCKC